ncbi:MAG TPA: hypothetical protein VFF31_01010 [Blastocatellia bacterium]|nr:hypothetical protein [Blastocatellia bacterium]
MNGVSQSYERQTPFGREQIHDLPWVKVIPYDYVADFQITGAAGNVIQDVINVSAEGVFVAIAIGYAFEEDRAEPVVLRSPGQARLGDMTLNSFPPDVLIEGFRIDPAFESVAFRGDQLDESLDGSVAQKIFQRIKPPENFGFLISIVDSATGRELQNEPVHSVATLGRADGQRPFKALSQPMVFMPRSTIRIQIEERTTIANPAKSIKGTLFITLQGYKLLGVAGNLEEAVRRLVELDPLKKIPVYDYETGNYRTLGEAVAQDLPTTGIVPFDYVSTLDLKGRPGNIEEDEVPVSVDGGYMTLGIGYSLDPGDTSLTIDLVEAVGNSDGNPTDPADLNKIRLKDIKPARALLDGIRIDPVRLFLAFTNSGLSTLPATTAGRMFQRLNLADDVRFLYTIVDSGTGRELQNQPVHSVAGLGIANGDRPFRVLHKPMTFLPRSTIRVQVREISGRGRLFIVFQGYKMLA